MHVITLTSEWNEFDYYVAALKGRLLTTCPEARIVDINHRIKPFNIAQAAFIVRNSYPSFPEGSIHIIAVSSEPEDGGQLLAARMNGHYFLCADNGILGLLGVEVPETVVRLNYSPDDPSASFISVSVFAGAAASLVAGKAIGEIGEQVNSFNRQVPMRPTLENNTITGSVIYIDSYNNAITNISRELFERIGRGKPFVIFVQSKHYKLEKINRRYGESDPGDLLAIFNSVGLLEIAIRNGNAASLLKLNTNSTIRVEFNEG
jgi:S-adenosyl-L-methionine hydrolase (adenosine-forming)